MSHSNRTGDPRQCPKSFVDGLTFDRDSRGRVKATRPRLFSSIGSVAECRGEVKSGIGERAA